MRDALNHAIQIKNVGGVGAAIATGVELPPHAVNAGKQVVRWFGRRRRCRRRR